MEPIQRKKIKMLKTISGTDLDEQGQSMGAKLYHAGEVYAVGPALEDALCEQLKIAERVSEKAAVAEKVVGAILDAAKDAGHIVVADGSAPSDAKALDGAPENKAKAPKRGKKAK